MSGTIGAIGSSTAASATTGAASTGSSTAGLEAQITQYKKQLADCVNCASAKTPAGKQQIQAITNKISSAQARIDQITQNASARAAATSSTDTTNTDEVAAAQAAQTTDPTQSTGQLVNVFA